jgi:hypothetical protein
MPHPKPGFRDENGEERALRHRGQTGELAKSTCLPHVSRRLRLIASCILSTPEHFARAVSVVQNVVQPMPADDSKSPQEVPTCDAESTANADSFENMACSLVGDEGFEPPTSTV